MIPTESNGWVWGVEQTKAMGRKGHLAGKQGHPIASHQPLGIGCRGYPGSQVSGATMSSLQLYFSIASVSSEPAPLVHSFFFCLARFPPVAFPGPNGGQEKKRTGDTPVALDFAPLGYAMWLWVKNRVTPKWVALVNGNLDQITCGPIPGSILTHTLLTC